MPTNLAGAESAAPTEMERKLSGSDVDRFAAPKWVLPVAAAMLLCSGSFDSIASKYMNKQDVPKCDGCAPAFFNAPFWQTFTMYLGEILCLGAYYIDYWITHKRGKAPTFDFPTSAKSFNKKACPNMWWLVPCVIDFTSSTMINYAFLITYASTVQMLRNFNVVITAILSLFVVKVALRFYQWLGIAVVTLGMIITGLYSIVNPDETSVDSDAWVGILLAVVGTLISAFQYVLEEWLFRRYYVSPMKAVGLEGFFGVIIAGVALGVVQAASWEDVKGSMYQIGHDGGLLGANISYVVSISVFNASGLMVTKLGSGVLRVILISFRTLFVWLIELCLKWNKFDWLNFCGLIVIVIGVFLFNHMYPSRWCKSVDKKLSRPWMCKGVRDPDILKDHSLKPESSDSIKAADIEKQANTESVSKAGVEDSRVASNSVSLPVPAAT